MAYRPPLARIITILMSIILASVGLFVSPMAQAEESGLSSSNECALIVQDGLKGQERTTTLFEHEVHYTYFEAHKAYIIAKELPRYQNSLLIHVDDGGHAMIWYNGKRIDSSGTPFFEIKSEVKPSQALFRGIVFVIKNLPQNFVANPESIMRTIENMNSVTCVSAACKSLQRIGVLNPEESASIRATSFIKFLLTLDSGTKQALGLEVLGLGVTPELHYKNIFRAELTRVPQLAAQGFIVGSSLILPLSFLFNFIFK